MGFDALVHGLSLVPAGVHPTILIRHAHRGPIEPGTFGDEVPLTEQGVREAEQLGEAFRPWGIRRIMSSPMERCVATARAILRGAGVVSEIPVDPALGVPGAFVEDSSLAGPQFLKLLPPEVMRRQLQGWKLPGMREPSDAISSLLGLVRDSGPGSGGLDLLVTHDSIIAGFIGHLLNIMPSDVSWPEMLEGPIFWPVPDGVNVVWRGLLYHADHAWSGPVR
jgi:broad specificity phosphatase PhoE